MMLYHGHKPGSVIPFSELASLGTELRRANKKVVFTNGCFDILHAGHVQILTEAKALGDILVVGTNDDASVRRLKGPQRPINSENDRAYVLAALKAVDYVVIFEHNTPIESIQALKPDIHVKGGDYTKDQLPETRIVESYGGKIEILRLREGHSTTRILNKI